MAEEGALTINLHPLVVMSIADHYTREFTQNKGTRVIGTVFGTQNGRDVQILETIEIPFKQVKGQLPELEQKAFEKDLALFKEAYPTFECLGWYSTGARPYEHDAEVHKLMTEYNERPLYILLNPNIKEDAKELPIQCFEQQVHVVQSKSTTEFVATKFQISADEAEQTTIVHCAKVISDEGDGSVVVPHYGSVGRAIKQLHTRIAILHKFLKDNKTENIPPSILREIKSLCQRLPTMDSPEFQQDFLTEYNDALLVTYLSTMTKGAQQVNATMDKFNMTYSGGMRGGGGGLGGMMGPMGLGMGNMMGMMGMM